MAIDKNILDCPIEPVVNILSGKWTPLILWEISIGNNRYGSIHKRLPEMNTRTLSQRLRMLEKNGVVNRKVLPTMPPTVKYEPTEKGLALKPILFAMRSWSEKYCN